MSAGGEGPVGGLLVRVRENVGGSPGAVVATTTSAADGRFSVDASGATPRVWVQVVGTTRWQGGHVGGQNPAGVQHDVSNADTYLPGTALGRTFVGPRFIRGVVTDAVSGEPVAGADVRLYVPGEAPSGTPERVLHTDAAGVFAATALNDEEYGIRISGAAGYETGWVGCGSGVVATYEDACTHGTGRLDRRVRLDPVGSTQSAAAEPLDTSVSGRLVNAYGGAALAGLTVRARLDNAGGPSTIIDTDTTAANGEFTLITSESEGDDVWVQVVKTPQWQGGYVGNGNPRYVELDIEDAEPQPSEVLGRIRVIPASMRGTVVNPGTGNPVRNATIRVYGFPGDDLQRTATTGRAGGFATTGLSGELFEVKVIGPAGYETGWLSCDQAVVPIVDRCVQTSGTLAHKVRLQRG